MKFDDTYKNKFMSNLRANSSLLSTIKITGKLLVYYHSLR